MNAPQIDSLRFTGAIADRSEYLAIVTYPSGGTTCAAFQGPTNGTGVVMLSTDYGASWVRVDSPERFGSTFGYEWVRRFFGGAA